MFGSNFTIIFVTIDEAKNANLSNYKEFQTFIKDLLVIMHAKVD